MVFAIHWHESAMGVYVFPILTLPPHPITQGHPSAPALSTLSHALNLDWWSISHMIIYMFNAFELWCWRRLLRVPWTARRSKPVHPKDQSWLFIGRTNAEAETPILWPSDTKSWLIGKDSDAGRDWGQEEKGTTEDEMAGWHHQLDGREFEWTLRDSGGQLSLTCCSQWGHKESDTNEQLNWTGSAAGFWGWSVAPAQPTLLWPVEAIAPAVGMSYVRKYLQIISGSHTLSKC